MRRLVLLIMSLVCALALSTSVVACGGDDDDTVDAGDGTEADAGGGDDGDDGGEPDGGDPHGVVPR